ncbi:MAG: DNA topoisomerase (ATP-hydrolyzing) subunit B [Patescibacteria group bacterium]|nr:DNA topoisomerase (ATP-hydrolyzing) subunit B [Patescibacteria group bacterium]
MAKKEVKKPSKEAEKSSYTAKDIYVLEGLEPVRKRPGMYIGSTSVDGLHHLVWEVVDNSIDEAMAGYARHITVKLLPDNKVSVEDDGRGIPVEIHPQTKKSALETVLTTLHAGGKFGGGSYKVSGGLHGVGISVVNALSSWLRVEVRRDGTVYSQEYKQGVPTTKITKGGKSEHTGTTVVFTADGEIFPKIEFDSKRILERLREQAYLTKGIRISFIDERQPIPYYYSFRFDGGVKSFLDYLNEGEDKVVQNESFYTLREENGINVECALNYNQGIETKELSFANNIYTPEGGAHLTGLRSALTRTLNDYARANSYLKEKDENLTGDDVREGLTVVISVKLAEPQFEGQTKAKLGNTEARTVTEAVIGEELSKFMEMHPSDARNVLEKCLIAQKARKAAKAAKETILRKGALEGLTLPGKLADCQSKKAEDSELFIVEGDSAGGSAKQARDRRTQAILPLRGKILNVEKSHIDKMLVNKEIRALVIALGTAIANDFDISKIRYHKVILMTDADVDGAHIRTLLLTLFYRYFPQVIESGYLYIAQPPLYRVQVGKEVKYAYTDAEKETVLKTMKGNPNIQRYKGLGEMNPDQLWDTTMDHKTRLLKVVTVDDGKEADRLFDILMGGEVESRRHFIQLHAVSVKNLDI